MSTTTTQRPARTLRPVAKDESDYGAIERAPGKPPGFAVAPMLNKRERQLMLAMLAQVDDTGARTPINRAALRTSANKMQEMYYAGWVMGAGSPDERGSGNTPESSWWWLTTYGEQIARAIGKQEAA